METKYPKHIAIILDGNRRWAAGRGLSPWQGHLEGYNNVKKLFDWIKELDIKEVTLYGFSLQNKSRSKKEVNGLIDLFATGFNELIKDKRIWKNKVKIRVIGRKTIFPDKLQKIFSDIEEKTKNHNNHIINFVLAYSGREEIVDAIKKIVNNKIDPSNIDENLIEKYLYIKSEPDIVIRTSGEQRISNFLLWQISYSELFFIKKYWPDFSRNDLKQIIDQYLNRHRRFGK